MLYHSSFIIYCLVKVYRFILGDCILGDVDGVVIIPKDIVNDVLDETFLLIEKENDVRD